MFLWTKKSFCPKICVHWIKVTGQKTPNNRYGPLKIPPFCPKLNLPFESPDEEVNGVFECEDEGNDDEDDADCPSDRYWKEEHVQTDADGDRQEISELGGNCRNKKHGHVHIQIIQSKI